MKKTGFFLIVFLFSLFGCDRTCNDTEACNYGFSEDCRYPENSQSVMEGTWNLVDMHDPFGSCIFSFSPTFDCELDETFESINLILNDDTNCEILTIPSSFSSSFSTGSWSFNVCENTLSLFHESFDNSNDGVYFFSTSTVFGSQKIIQLESDMFLSEDLAGNILRWEKL